MRAPAPVLAAYALLLSACGAMDWMGDPSSADAREITTLSWVVMIVFTAVSLVVWIILGYLLVRRRRGTFADHMPITTKSGMGWIWVWGLIVPGLLFAAALVASIVLMFTASVHHDVDRKPDIIVTGHQWWWELRYTGDTPDESFVTANEIHIPVGRPVVIRLRSADVIHSFWIPKLQGKVDLVPGRDNTIIIQADTPGRYEGQCMEFCGAQHAMMRLVVVAQHPVQYEAWRFQQHAPALIPRHEPEITGAATFQKRACGLCHTIRGTSARGTVGPDLTHVGSREMIGANSIPNDRAHLQAWIVRPHSLKPQMQMPNLFTFTGEEVNAVAIYLRSLK